MAILWSAAQCYLLDKNLALAEFKLRNKHIAQGEKKLPRNATVWRVSCGAAALLRPWRDTTLDVLAAALPSLTDRWRCFVDPKLLDIICCFTGGTRAWRTTVSAKFISVNRMLKLSAQKQTHIILAWKRSKRTITELHSLKQIYFYMMNGANIWFANSARAYTVLLFFLQLFFGGFTCWFMEQQNTKHQHWYAFVKAFCPSFIEKAKERKKEM